MEEIKLNMENLTKEEREQLLKLVEKANKKESKVWKPAYGDVYYVITCDGSICSNCWYAGEIEKRAYYLGNCFRTKEEAEFALERQRVIVELERFAKESGFDQRSAQSGVILSCNRLPRIPSESKPRWVLGTVRYYPGERLGGGIAFCSEFEALQAVQGVGEERIKKYYFGVKE